MRISDWSSDVCSSDLTITERARLEADLAEGVRRGYHVTRGENVSADGGASSEKRSSRARRWSCCLVMLRRSPSPTDRKSAVSGKSVSYVSISVVAVSLKKKITQYTRNTP